MRSSRDMWTPTWAGSQTQGERVRESEEQKKKMTRYRAKEGMNLR